LVPLVAPPRALVNVHVDIHVDVARLVGVRGVDVHIGASARLVVVALGRLFALIAAAEVVTSAVALRLNERFGRNTSLTFSADQGGLPLGLASLGLVCAARLGSFCCSPPRSPAPAGCALTAVLASLAREDLRHRIGGGWRGRYAESTRASIV